MAQSQVRPFTFEELQALNATPQSAFDPSKVSQAFITGSDLAESITKRKQSQEDREKALAKEIKQALAEAKFQKTVKSNPNPSIGDIASYIPKESAESLLKQRLLEESESGKLERAKLKNEMASQAPDKIKQLFQLGDKTVGVTYGGALVPITVPGGEKLNPLEKTLPAESATQLGDFDTLSSQLEKVKASVKPEFTGPVESRTGELAQTLDIPSLGLGASPQRADFLSNINSIRNQLIYLRSGKQINEKEYERLLSELPNEHRSDVDFAAKLANFENVFNEIKNNRRKSLSGAGFNVPGNTPPAAPTGNPGGLDINALGAALRLPRKAGR